MRLLQFTKGVIKVTSTRYLKNLYLVQLRVSDWSKKLEFFARFDHLTNTRNKDQQVLPRACIAKGQ